MLLPIDNLAVCVMCVFGTKGRPANQTFEHDSTNRPPVTAKRVASAGEDLWSYVIGSAHRGVSKDTTGFAPGVDLSAIANCEVDLVKGNGLAVLALLLFRAPFQELLVVGIVMLFVKASGKAKISEFDVAASIEENVVWLDVPDGRLVLDLWNA